MKIHKYGRVFKIIFQAFVFSTHLYFYGGNFELLLYSGQVKKKDEIESLSGPDPSTSQHRVKQT